jgi:hypothetical protein
VWKLVTDIEVPARFSPELQHVEWLDDAIAPGVGARFAGYNRHPAIGEWRTVSEIVELDPERAFGWSVMDADGRFGAPSADPAKPMATWRFGLEPDPNGSCLRQSVCIGPGRSGLSVAIDHMPDKEENLVAGRLGELRIGIESTLRGIKAVAEDPRPGDCRGGGVGAWPAVDAGRGAGLRQAGATPDL